jgi:hypothetical protein
MQLPMTTYQQVCFCITNDVVMSISLMYEKAEAGEYNMWSMNVSDCTVRPYDP